MDSIASGELRPSAERNAHWSPNGRRVDGSRKTVVPRRRHAPWSGSDQVAERSLRHEVLGREEPVVAREINLGPHRHRFAQEVGTDPTRGRFRNRPAEEHPDVGALARSRALKGHRNPGSLSRVDVRTCVEGPGRAVEVARKEPASVVEKERVQADVHPTREVRLDDPVAQRQIRTILSPSVGRTADDYGAPS
jgi:hypothetical protein